jgi:hypothetical protein
MIVLWLCVFAVFAGFAVAVSREDSAKHYGKTRRAFNRNLSERRDRL